MLYSIVPRPPVEVPGTVEAPPDPGTTPIPPLSTSKEHMNNILNRFGYFYYLILFIN
jgi:hypothetical protein